MNITAKKMKFSINDSFSKCDAIRKKIADLVTFTKEIFNGKLHFFVQCINLINQSFSQSISGQFSISIYIPWSYQKPFDFSVLRRHRNGTLAWRKLMINFFPTKLNKILILKTLDVWQTKLKYQIFWKWKRGLRNMNYCRFW